MQHVSPTSRGLVRQIEVEAVVIRADGTREDLGTVAYWNRSFLKRIAARLRGIGGQATCE